MDSQLTMVMLLMVALLFGLANLIGLVMLWVHLDRRGTDTRNLDRRVTQLEAQVSGGLSAEEIRELFGRLADMEARLEVIDERSARIDKFLMEESKK
jgi:hypothetical protein